MATYHHDNLALLGAWVGGVRRVWGYRDTGAAISDVVASGFIADGNDKGMKANDFVVFVDETNNKIYGLRVSAVQSTGATQVTLDGQVTLADTS